MENVDKPVWCVILREYYNDVIMRARASQISSLAIVYSTVYSSRSISKKISKFCVTGLCAGIHRWPVNSLQKGPVTRKIFPFDDVIMFCLLSLDWILFFNRSFDIQKQYRCFFHIRLYICYHPKHVFMAAKAQPQRKYSQRTIKTGYSALL